MENSPEAIVCDVVSQNLLDKSQKAVNPNPDQTEHYEKVEAFYKRIGRLIREGRQIIPKGEDWELEGIYASYYTELYQSINIGWEIIIGDSEGAIALREQVMIDEAFTSPKMLLKAIITQDAFAMVLPALYQYRDFSPRNYYSGYIAMEKIESGDAAEKISASDDERKQKREFRKLEKKHKGFSKQIKKEQIEVALPKTLTIALLEKNKRKLPALPALSIHLNALSQLSDQLEKRGKRSLKKGFGYVARNGKFQKKGKGGKLS